MVISIKIFKIIIITKRVFELKGLVLEAINSHIMISIIDLNKITSYLLKYLLASLVVVVLLTKVSLIFNTDVYSVHEQ